MGEAKEDLERLFSGEPSAQPTPKGLSPPQPKVARNELPWVTIRRRGGRDLRDSSRPAAAQQSGEDDKTEESVHGAMLTNSRAFAFIASLPAVCGFMIPCLRPRREETELPACPLLA